MIRISELYRFARLLRLNRPVRLLLVNCLDVLKIVEGGWYDRLTLMELRPKLSNEPAEAGSRMDEVGSLEKQMHAAGKDSEALRVARAHIGDFTAERTSLTVSSGQSRVEQDTWLIGLGS